MLIDLHCDLLSYLAVNHKRSCFDRKALCSYPQLKEGGVKLQVLAIFASTETDSEKSGEKQAEIFSNLSKNSPFKSFQGELNKEVGILAAIENASSFCSEQEPIEKGLKRIENISEKVGKILYIGLTWNGENRFGGGSGSSSGLKEEGKLLLDWMDKKSIAVDFSHASDRLAEEILSYIDKKALRIRVMASHSNFRTVFHHQRNLPDEVAKEIIKRKGIIGLVLYKKFVNPEDPYYILRHVEHGLHLGGEETLCFGSDFFYFEDFANNPLIDKSDGCGFFEEYGDASKYPFLLNLLEKRLALNPEQMKKICYENALKFMNLSR